MGWTTYHATFYKNGKVDRKAEMDNLYTWENDNKKVSVVKSSMVGSVYYAAVKVENKGDKTEEVTGAVALTCGTDRRDPYYNFGYKDMSEDMGPCEYDCPTGILDLLTPTESEWANEWRRKCREKKKQPKLSDLNVGAKIKFKMWNGAEYELVKRAPNFQFKRTWWHNPANNTYMPSRYIPSTFEIVTE